MHKVQRRVQQFEVGRVGGRCRDFRKDLLIPCRLGVLDHLVEWRAVGNLVLEIAAGFGGRYPRDADPRGHLSRREGEETADSDVRRS